MQFQFVVCQACGNVYILSESRYYCPVCSGTPLSLEGILAVIQPEVESAAPEEVAEEAPPPTEVPSAPASTEAEMPPEEEKPQ